jgi:hypothetical protein
MRLMGGTRGRAESSAKDVIANDVVGLAKRLVWQGWLCKRVRGGQAN